MTSNYAFQRALDPMKRLMAAAVMYACLCGAATAQDVTNVAMVQLIATPERFHGKLVRVIAFFKHEFEGTVLYPHREDYDQALIPNGIWIDVPLNNSSYKAMSLGYVVAEGTFDAKSKGHMGMWSGTLTKVSRLQKWEPKK
jgi:hypothetical protein